MQRLSHDSASRLVPALPDEVYALVSDVTRTPEWSPEVVSSTWDAPPGPGGPRPGDRFTARLRKGWARWSNRPVVVEADPGRTFAVSRTERGGGTMVWRYDLVPVPGGTRVTLSYDVERPVPLGLHVALRVLLGVRDLRADLHANIETSLDRLERVLAGAGRAASG
ncbi:SRPBCC family protein [Vallicoccus soli]|uniref:SRPBCC family protein n=1 Tax=Vallicoccus soli TaxID=2339232 RepID=A0A3A3Z3W1_9ACTN|nr:SRPBCC family protein [Vallicoccus soli]RJK96306.1 SRPBCC family protein [Vallicoccus soli]